MIPCMTTINVTATNPRPSTCLPREGALDVDVTLGIGWARCTGCGAQGDRSGVTHCDCPADTVVDNEMRHIGGEVTLVRGHDGTLVAYGGQPDHWVSGNLLHALRGLSETDYRVALSEI